MFHPCCVFHDYHTKLFNDPMSTVLIIKLLNVSVAVCLLLQYHFTIWINHLCKPRLDCLIWSLLHTTMPALCYDAVFGCCSQGVNIGQLINHRNLYYRVLIPTILLCKEQTNNYPCSHPNVCITLAGPLTSGVKRMCASPWHDRWQVEVTGDPALEFPLLARIVVFQSDLNLFSVCEPRALPKDYFCIDYIFFLYIYT